MSFPRNSEPKIMTRSFSVRSFSLRAVSLFRPDWSVVHCSRALSSPARKATAVPSLPSSTCTNWVACRVNLIERALIRYSRARQNPASPEDADPKYDDADGCHTDRSVGARQSKERFHSRPPNSLARTAPKPENSRESPQRSNSRWLLSFNPKPVERRKVQSDGRFQATTGAM